ncbi:MAG: PilX N-terminal domain-containing pilus assembly protein [Candidatus Limnocylindria bacterium]
MDARALMTSLKDERGIALPMALMALMLLSVLVIAFVQISTTEPIIANNQHHSAQARAVAEAGLERAAWALDNPTDPNGLPTAATLPAAPYDGATAFPLDVNGTQLGVFTVAVTNGAAANERSVEAVGWVPTNTGSGPKTHQRISAALVKLRFLDPPAALSVRGELQISGNSLVDSRADVSCGPKAGTMSLETTTIQGGAADVFGAGNDTQNEATDALTNQPGSVFDDFTYSTDELDMLKSLAKSRGTYYQGTVSFNSGNQMPNGIIYVDTVSGTNITDTTPTEDFASVAIHGGAPADPSGIFSGWLVVAGALAISGDFRMHGMVYVQNDFTYTGTGTGEIVGAVISHNVRDTSSTTIDTNTGGNASVNYNCAYARTGGGQLPQTWTLKAGTYKEIPDP